MKALLTGAFIILIALFSLTLTMEVAEALDNIGKIQEAQIVKLFYDAPEANENIFDEQNTFELCVTAEYRPCVLLWTQKFSQNMMIITIEKNAFIGIVPAGWSAKNKFI